MVLGNILSDLEARYSHLLQPIRDLAKNWDIDIASHLEEYLDEVKSLLLLLLHSFQRVVICI